MPSAVSMPVRHGLCHSELHFASTRQRSKTHGEPVSGCRCDQRAFVEMLCQPLPKYLRSHSRCSSEQTHLVTAVYQTGGTGQIPSIIALEQPLPNQQAARIGLIKVLLKLKTGAGLTFLAARRVKAGLALLPRQARMPPAIDLAAVPERVKVAFKTVTDIDHRLVTGAQRGIAGG